MHGQGSRQIAHARFAQIMASLAGGVAVVTTRAADGSPKGLTTTGICSASAEPPLLLICVDGASRTLGALRESGRFVANFMSAGEDELCRRFASKRDDKFEGLRWRPSRTGLPVLSDHVIAWTECRTTTEYGAGDHVILLGRVEDGDVLREDAEPLVYYGRAWGFWHPYPKGAWQ
jgi:flavin reductase ActVB